MSHQHVADRTPGERVVKRQHGASRNAEHRVDPATRQCFDQGIGAAHPSLLRRRWWSRWGKTGTRISEVMASLRGAVGERKPAPSAGLRAGRDRRGTRECRSEASRAGSYRRLIATFRLRDARTSRALPPRPEIPHLASGRPVASTVSEIRKAHPVRVMRHRACGTIVAHGPSRDRKDCHGSGTVRGPSS